MSVWVRTYRPIRPQPLPRLEYVDRIVLSDPWPPGSAALFCWRMVAGEHVVALVTRRGAGTRVILRDHKGVETVLLTKVHRNAALALACTLEPILLSYVRYPIQLHAKQTAILHDPREWSAK